ncbi:hypothetical protein HDV05_003931 [Chytridiales sp. JEL 0842]|nr:hypothetical protein HDV05_003931 [Chytridiales sp. JEL 0842]
MQSPTDTKSSNNKGNPSESSRKEGSGGRPGPNDQTNTSTSPAKSGQKSNEDTKKKVGVVEDTFQDPFASPVTTNASPAKGEQESNEDTKKKPANVDKVQDPFAGPITTNASSAKGGQKNNYETKKKPSDIDDNFQDPFAGPITTNASTAKVGRKTDEDTKKKPAVVDDEVQDPFASSITTKSNPNATSFTQLEVKKKEEPKVSPSSTKVKEDAPLAEPAKTQNKAQGFKSEQGMSVEPAKLKGYVGDGSAASIDDPPPPSPNVMLSAQQKKSTSKAKNSTAAFSEKEPQIDSFRAGSTKDDNNERSLAPYESEQYTPTKKKRNKSGSNVERVEVEGYDDMESTSATKSQRDEKVANSKRHQYSSENDMQGGSNRRSENRRPEKAPSAGQNSSRIRWEAPQKDRSESDKEDEYDERRTRSTKISGVRDEGESAATQKRPKSSHGREAQSQRSSEDGYYKRQKPPHINTAPTNPATGLPYGVPSFGGQYPQQFTQQHYPQQPQYINHYEDPDLANPFADGQQAPYSPYAALHPNGGYVPHNSPYLYPPQTPTLPSYMNNPEYIAQGRPPTGCYTRWIAPGREVKIWEEEDAAAFDEIVAWKNAYPDATEAEALSVFCNTHRSADALVPVVYDNERWDYVLRYEKPLLEALSKNLSHAEAAAVRWDFENRMCMLGLIVEVEESLETDLVFFVKIKTPFHVLCTEARALKIVFPVQSTTLVDDNEDDTQPFFACSYKLNLNQHYAVLDAEDVSNYLFKFKKPDNSFEWTRVAGQTADVVRTMFFEERYRILITYNLILKTEIRVRRKGIVRNEGIKYLIEQKVYSDWYALHERDNLQRKHRVLGKLLNSIDDLNEAGIPASAARNAGEKGASPMSTSPGNEDQRLLKSPHKQLPIEDNWGGSGSTGGLTTRSLLLVKWAKMRLFGHQPMDMIRDYFGEKVAFYFLYLEYYNSWLVYSAIFGTLVFIAGIGFTAAPVGGTQGTPNRLIDNGLTPIFGFFMSVWAVLYFEYWKRRNAYYTHRWAVHNFEETEIRRHNFQAIGSRVSRITGRRELYFPDAFRLQRQAISTIVVILCALVVILSVIGQVAMIAHMQSLNYSPLSISFSVSFLGLLSIQVCRRVFHPLAESLTAWENYKTESEHENALILKIWAFEFCNIYAHIIYFAFIRPFVDHDQVFGIKTGQPRCTPDECSSAVTLELVVFFIGDQTIGRMEEVLVPLIMAKIRSIHVFRKKVEPTKRTHWPQHYKDEKRATYGGVDADYFQKAVQYTYATMFVTAFPLAPLLALINNIMEVRTDAFKFLKSVRRPPTLQAQDIGPWETVMKWSAILAVTTNGLLVSLTSDFFFTIWVKPYPETQWAGIRFGFLLIWHIVVYCIALLVSWLVPDEPSIVTLAKAKARYMERIAVDPNWQAEDELEENGDVKCTGIVHSGEALESKLFGSLQRAEEAMNSALVAPSPGQGGGMQQGQPPMAQRPGYEMAGMPASGQIGHAEQRGPQVAGGKLYPNAPLSYGQRPMPPIEKPQYASTQQQRQASRAAYDDDTEQRYASKQQKRQASRNAQGDDDADEP